MSLFLSFRLPIHFSCAVVAARSFREKPLVKEPEIGRRREAALPFSFHTVAEIYICRKTIKYRRYYGIKSEVCVRVCVFVRESLGGSIEGW